MQTTSLRHIAYLAEYCANNGVTDIVLSPGSRNAPLIIAFEAHPKIKPHLIHDERSAGFYALGLAEASDKVVALSCTSGSALLNYSPALVEAYYRQLPLLVLSADRPTELIDQGDGQTIRQAGVYKNFIKKDFQFPDSDDKDVLVQTKVLCEEAFGNLLNKPYGPIHINIPVAEPLYETSEFESFDILPMQPNEAPSMDEVESSDLAGQWNSVSKKLVIVGQSAPNKRKEQLLQELASDPSVAVLVENTSNMQDFNKFCHCIDRTLAAIGPDELKDFAPELLISIEGAVISKRIKAYFRKYKAKFNYRIGEFSITEDTYQSLTKAFNVRTEAFLEYLIKLSAESQSNFGGQWKQKDFLAQQKHEEFLKSTSYADLSVFEVLLDLLPDDSNLHMGNSSVIRYCQLFNPIKGIQYFSNRGVSGIDGSSSTAAGFSQIGRDRLNVLISGDISFFYDSNAFWNERLTGNLKVIVISNGGGGIFQIIPGPAKSDQAKTFFAPTKASVQGVCEAYNLNYYHTTSLKGIPDTVESFFKIENNNRPSILEISTQDCKNAEVLASYFDHITTLHS